MPLRVVRWFQSKRLPSPDSPYMYGLSQMQLQSFKYWWESYYLLTQGKKHLLLLLHLQRLLVLALLCLLDVSETLLLHQMGCHLIMDGAGEKPRYLRYKSIRTSVHYLKIFHSFLSIYAVLITFITQTPKCFTLFFVCALELFKEKNDGLLQQITEFVTEVIPYQFSGNFSMFSVICNSFYTSKGRFLA